LNFSFYKNLKLVGFIADTNLRLFYLLDKIKTKIKQNKFLIFLTELLK